MRGAANVADRLSLLPFREDLLIHLLGKGRRHAFTMSTENIGV
jgi:hypothetical protein